MKEEKKCYKIKKHSTKGFRQKLQITDKNVNKKTQKCNENVIKFIRLKNP